MNVYLVFVQVAVQNLPVGCMDDGGPVAGGKDVAPTRRGERPQQDGLGAENHPLLVWKTTLGKEG